MEINAKDVIQVTVSVLVSIVILGVLTPILSTMTAEGGALAQYADIVNIIPMVIVVVILIMALTPILRKNLF